MKGQPLLMIKAVQVRKVLNSRERFKVFVGKWEWGRMEDEIETSFGVNGWENFVASKWLLSASLVSLSFTFSIPMAIGTFNILVVSPEKERVYSRRVFSNAKGTKNRQRSAERKPWRYFALHSAFFALLKLTPLKSLLKSINTPLILMIKMNQIAFVLL